MEIREDGKGVKRHKGKTTEKTRNPGAPPGEDEKKAHGKEVKPETGYGS